MSRTPETWMTRTCNIASRTGAHALVMMLALTAAAAFSGCGGHEPTTRITPVTGELDKIPMSTRGAPVLVLAPLDVPESWTAAETYKRTMQLSELLSREGWPVIAPWEYDQRQLRNSKKLLEQTDVVLIAREMDVEPTQLWVLRVNVSESTTTQNTVVVDDEGEESGRARDLRVTHIVDMNVYDPRLSRMLGGATANIPQNPFDPDANVVDALPNLTDALPEAVEVLTEAMAAQGAGPADVSLAGDYQMSPRRVGSYEQGDMVALDEELADYPKVEQLARKVVHYQFFVPYIEVEQIKRYEAMPMGVSVLDPGAYSDSGLRKGDFITEINGQPVGGVYALRRALAVGRGKLMLTVLRNGEPRRLVINT